MDTQLFQNIDNPQVNPLTPKQDTTTVKPVSKIDIKDPKIIVLIVLSAILAVLLVASIIVSLTRGDNSKSIKLPNNQSQVITTPTTIVDILPQTYRATFDKIQKNINTNEEYLPPVIDVQIGL